MPGRTYFAELANHPDTSADTCPRALCQRAGLSLPHADVRCAAPQRKKLEHPYVLPQSVLDAVVGFGAVGQAAIRHSGSFRFRALERAA